MQRNALCRSRRELSNEYLLAKIGVDTAENEPLQVCPLSAYRSPRSVLRVKDPAPAEATAESTNNKPALVNDKISEKRKPIPNLKEDDAAAPSPPAGVTVAESGRRPSAAAS